MQHWKLEMTNNNAMFSHEGPLAFWSLHIHLGKFLSKKKFLLERIMHDPRWIDYLMIPVYGILCWRNPGENIQFENQIQIEI